MEKLVLIDGNSLINRAFYAVPLLVTKDGKPINAVYGFMNMFVKMFSEVKPTYVGVAFDLKAPTFRHKMYAEYKGTRKPMPDELRPQIPLLKEVLKTMGVAIFEKEGYEADDIIGTIAKKTSVMTYIYTGDKDSFQLVDNETKICFTKKGISDIQEYNENNFNELTGIYPNQVTDLKALMGDSSDNIPGISGIGPKTAVDLLTKYHDIDNLYTHVEELTGKLYEKIKNGEESCRLSKVLATIDTDSPIDFSLEKMGIIYPFKDEVKTLFKELEFKTLSQRKDLFAEKSGEENASIDTDEKAEEGQKNDKESDISHVKTEKVATLSDFNAKNVITCDTVSLAILTDKVCVYFGDVEYQFTIMQNLLDDGFSLSDILVAIKDIFAFDGTLILFDKKSVKHLLDGLEIKLTAKAEDISIMKYIADFSGRDESIESVISEYGYEDLPTAFALTKVYQTLKDKLAIEQMESLYRDVELPLADVLFDMEKNGFKVDVVKLKETGERYKEILAGLESEIRKLTGEPELNVNSPKQLGELLFGKLNLAKGKKTKTGYSTNAEVLEEIEDLHPSIPLILRYRQIQKLNSTYIEGLGELVDKATGIIHTSFNQTVTATGRLSSKEPNLQNIPIREDEGRELRKLFVPKSDDRILIGADYSQIELRLLASFSGCKGLIDAFNNGVDVHSATASKVFGVKPEEVSPQMRRSAKAVNFGIIYGISEYGLAKNLKIPNWQAREYIDTYFKEYPEVKAYMNANVEFAKENGYATTLLGRKRYIRELKAQNYNLRQFGERVAMNMPLQGSSADIIKIAMVNVAKELKERGLKSQLILQIHDELIIDAFEEEKEEVKTLLKNSMENAVKLAVPLTVDMGEGKTWYEAK